MTKTSWVSRLSQLWGGLLVGRRAGCHVRSVLLAQLRRAGEGIGCYRRRAASITLVSRLAIVRRTSRHLRRALLLVMGLSWSSLEGIGGGMEHRNGTGRLNDWREYLSHRNLLQKSNVRSSIGIDNEGNVVGVERQPEAKRGIKIIPFAGPVVGGGRLGE